MCLLAMPMRAFALDVEGQYVGAGALHVNSELIPTVTLGVNYTNGLAFDLQAGYLETEYKESDWDRYDNQITLLIANLKQTFYSNGFSDVYIRGSIGGLWWESNHFERAQVTDPYLPDGSGSDNAFLWGLGAGINLNYTERLTLNVDAGMLGLDGSIEELDYSKTDTVVQANAYFRF
ncbi:hypothetical protein ATN88_16495 [Enterovibrio coralii]|uniref:Outer membrane protein beta-barrel domain-containing protein n=2 Tax=Enterovibrio coralii TaxID=294935 RepID=A0A135I5Y2_9GAMM|nr:hypothetical protein ATN88_16495 [Enterovibrio coralii]